MNSYFPPNSDPNVFALTAVAIAAALTSDFNSYELNSIGNWLELMGQYLLVVAAQQQLINFRNQQINNSQQINYLIDAIKKIEKELEQIKKEI